MAKQLIGIGSAPNDNTGDTLRVGADKVNDNFDEIYSALGNQSELGVNIANAGTGQVLRYNGSAFVADNLSTLTSALDVNGNSIISSSNGEIRVAPNGTGDINLIAGGVTTNFDGATGVVDVPTKLQYKNEFASLGAAPSAATYTGYYFTVDGDDNPYVNINITAGGAGDVQAKILTEYSSIDLLSDVDTTTTAPTNNQVLKWNGTNWAPADDSAGVSSVNLFATVAGDTGSTTANSASDTLTIAGGTNIATAVSGDTLTINFDGTLTTTFAALTDTDVSGLTQGDSLYWNGTDWVRTASPIIWWELNANGSSDYTFSGPGFAGTVNDPDLYVYRGFTYVFDNSVQGGGHPFRIQETTGLSGQAYTAGQTGSGSSILYWTVPMDAPTTLYYQCTLHALMNGTITVVS
ncbi:baseplate wedge subunit and tail pin [Synechococcus phage S-MS29]|nr:baseplate wedge subunit and tail pin [Synechococcus phage S-MS29]